jgi:hypothetical protein
MKVLLFNDTGSWPHVGCLAVSYAHQKMLAREGIEVIRRFFVNEYVELWRGNRDSTELALRHSELPDLMSDVDAVIVNGEGTIHHGAGLHLLAILDLALSLGKGAFLVNAVIQEVGAYEDTLVRLTDLVVRDARTAQYLEEMGARPRLVPDSILEADFYPGHDDSFKDKIIFTDCHWSRHDVFEQLGSAYATLADQAIHFPLEAPERFDDWRSSLMKFRAAKLIITGRHHGVYLALMAKTPFIALPSNTWKIEGLIDIIGTDEMLWKGGSLVAMIKNESDKYLPDANIFNHEFLSHPLKTFSVLKSFY